MEGGKYRQAKFSAHFYSSDHNSFLNDTDIDKTNPSGFYMIGTSAIEELITQMRTSVDVFTFLQVTNVFTKDVIFIDLEGTRHSRKT